MVRLLRILILIAIPTLSTLSGLPAHAGLRPTDRNGTRQSIHCTDPDGKTLGHPEADDGRLPRRTLLDLKLADGFVIRFLVSTQDFDEGLDLVHLKGVRLDVSESFELFINLGKKTGRIEMFGNRWVFKNCQLSEWE